MSSIDVSAPRRASVSGNSLSPGQAAAARRVKRLAALTSVRHARWLRLYCEPDVWTDTVKRRQMMQSRWQYQRAVLVYLMASRPD